MTTARPRQSSASVLHSLQMQERLRDEDELTPERCPHCGVSRPCLALLNRHGTKSHRGENYRTWASHKCTTCGGVVLSMTPVESSYITKMWPEMASVPDTVPERAREFLSQALGSLHAPAGALMLTASSVDAMLKEKGLKAGNLYSRIDKAAADHLITDEMAKWAHEVRLDANDQRHADENASLPSRDDAERVIEFTQALAQFLFVLPAMVTHGRKAHPRTATSTPAKTSPTAGMPGSGA